MPQIIDLVPTPATALIAKATTLIENMPTLGNAAILANSTCTAGRALGNFCCANNTLSRVCFGTSCVLKVTGAVCSGLALLSIV